MVKLVVFTGEKKPKKALSHITNSNRLKLRAAKPTVPLPRCS